MLVDSGKVDQREVEVMRALIELEERGGFSELKNATYYKTYFINNDYLIIVLDMGVSTSVPVFTRIAKRIEAALSEKLGGVRVKLVPKVSDLRTLAAHLLYPARVLGINYVYMPDGKVEYVVRVSRRDRRRIEPQKDFYEKLLSELIGENVRIRFE